MAVAMVGVTKLIEKEAAMQNLRNQLQIPGLQPGQCIVSGIVHGPCLLLTREYGCSGGVIVRRAGERLGWNVFDREIVNENDLVLNTAGISIDGATQIVLTALLAKLRVCAEI